MSSSRRESRSSLGARQNDALFEFETFKKKFLLANKHITKLNSTLSVRIEELNGQISMLYVENLRLRASEIALAAQLKREREQSRKVLVDAEAASQSLTKHLIYLRETFHPRPSSPTPPTPPSPRAKRPLANPNDSPTAATFNRISRAPNIPGIYEDEEPTPSSADEDERENDRAVQREREREREKDKLSPPKKKSKTKPRLSASKLPLPARVVSPPPSLLPPQRHPTLVVDSHVVADFSFSATGLPTPTSSSSSSGPASLGSATPAPTKPRKAVRRQSGLLTVNTHTEALSVPRSGSPAFGSPIRYEAGLAEEEEERAVISTGGYVRDEEPISGGAVAASVTVRKEKKEKKEKKDRGSESERDGNGTSREKEKKRSTTKDADEATEPTLKPKNSRGALQPIDRNVEEPLELETVDGKLSAVSSLQPPRQFLRPVSPVDTVPSTSRGSSNSPVPPESSEAGAGTGGREKRARKSVNYAEPKLNTKMRKPDPLPGTAPEPPRKKRASAAAVLTSATATYRPPSSNAFECETTDREAVEDSDAPRSSLEYAPVPVPVPSIYALPHEGGGDEFYPTSTSRRVPGSAAAMYAPSPPSRTATPATGSTTSSVFSETGSARSATTQGTSAATSAASGAGVGTSGTESKAATIKRKKSKPRMSISDEESDGADADYEYTWLKNRTQNANANGYNTVIGNGRGGFASEGEANVDMSRRRAIPKRSAAAAALDDIRRHSMAI